MRSLVRLVLLFRLIALNVTIFELPGSPDQVPGVMAGLVVAAFASFLPLRYWDRWAGPLSTRPVFLAADLMLNLTIYAYLGPASPFFLYTLGTPLLAGLLFRTTGAILLGFAMLAGYYVLVVLSGNGLAELRAHEARDIQALVVLPALYPLAAAGGAAVRGLLDRQAVTQLALASAERRAAAGAERARVAREMHDSLGKTLYGIALAARGLSHRIEAEAPGAAAAARDLSASAQIAAEEARGLISDLRSDTLDRPLRDALERYVREWSERNGIAAHLQADGVDLPHPGTRYELFCIVREALENVERHAGATSVQVLLRDMAPDVVLSVVDDGVGIGGVGDARSLQTNGHYGLIGMAERGERIGATVRIAGQRGAGTTVTVRLPAGDVRAPEPWVLEEAVE
ncbi:MAG TPA: histidine kinase [Solirubrobacteraceae bacterium]